VVSESPKSKLSDSSVEQTSNEQNQDTRSTWAKAVALASRITTISVMMVVPALGGYYLDQYLGTVVLFLFLGMIFGVAASVWQLYKLIQFQNQL